MGGRLGIVVALLASAVLVGLGVMSFQQGTAVSRPVVLPVDLFWCGADDDCVAVDRIGCCSCREGGGQAAITSWHQDDLRRFLKGACHHQQVCVQVDLCRTDLRPRCIERQCKLVFSDG